MNLAMRLATGTMLSLALVSVPASARPYRGHGHHYRHHGGGIGTLGGILLGAAVLGTVAAIANDNRSYGYDPRYQGNIDPRDRDYRERYDAATPRDLDRQPVAGSAGADPVEDCSRAAERQAQADGGFARVAGIDGITDIDGGAEVRGRLEIVRGANAPVTGVGFTCTAAFGAVTRLRLG